MFAVTTITTVTTGETRVEQCPLFPVKPVPSQMVRECIATSMRIFLCFYAPPFLMIKYTIEYVAVPKTYIASSGKASRCVGVRRGRSGEQHITGPTGLTKVLFLLIDSRRSKRKSTGRN